MEEPHTIEECLEFIIKPVHYTGLVLLLIFPQYKNKICCFSYDWMGRQFAIDITDPKKNYLFDAATGEDFELPQTLNGFFNEELVDYRDDTLIPEDFNDILKKLKIDILSPNKCIGYKQLLFLGGEDNLDNTEVIDMDIYWNMNYQIYSKIHKMKKRNIINNIKYE
ncbi:T6SS immunity protein Tdi1 domain-containing protein [Mesonia maritima]|uniref:T6SS immunity protein Tdi1 domain-containing protein n=1 Tax=Mesonia maritima TaxID=1793873 RepID=UPI003634CE12